MKILEAQNAALTNVEVYEFLSNQAKEYHNQKRRGPANLETLRKEVLQYFESPPGPLSQKPLPYDSSSISVLVKRLHPYNISKGELIMLLNMRPTSIPTLNSVIEDMELRFDEEKQLEIINIIIEVLGQFPSPSENGGEVEGVMQTTEG
ncbi:HRDC-like protein [Xylariaceae sp. FL0662B]|nr:HRDC-like protein [Xylariaceae sp. FL0662B]